MSGRVVRQEPEAGQPIKRGGIVKVVLGMDTKVRFPDLTGRELRSALKMVDKMELPVDKVELVKKKNKAGTVLGHFPEPGGVVSAQTRVILRVASGADEADMRTVVLLFGRHRVAGNTGLSATVLSDRLVKAEVVSPTAVLDLVAGAPAKFAKRMGMDDKTAARVLQGILKEITKLFPGAG